MFPNRFSKVFKKINPFFERYITGGGKRKRRWDK
jgi:hypothetical protein